MRPDGLAVVGLLIAACSAPDAGGGPAPVGSLPAPGAAVGVVITPSRAPRMDDRLIAAAARGDLAAVRRAHVRGASVKARDDRGRTALVAAAYGNHLPVTRFLIAAGADVNAKDESVQSAYLISTAEVGDDPRLLNLTIENGARINDKDSFNGTALIRAADRGYPRIVKRLLKEDIDIDHVNRLGWTALHEAIILGDGSPRYVKVVELLVAAGADVSLPSRDDGLTPVEHAQARGYEQVVEILRRAER